MNVEDFSHYVSLNLPTIMAGDSIKFAQEYKVSVTVRSMCSIYLSIMKEKNCVC